MERLRTKNICRKRSPVLVIVAALLLPSWASMANDGALGPQEEHARVEFRLRNYHGALRYLMGAPWTLDSQWIKAESLFRLKKYADAKKVFLELAQKSEDPVELRKIELRLFDCELLAFDVQDAINRYVAYKKKYNRPPAKMVYGLGKTLLDVGYANKAVTVLKSVPKGSEYFMRARYIIAAGELDDKSAKESLKTFRAIENQPLVSVEDHAVKQMAILAQARIYLANNRYDLAEKTYGRVPVDGDLGEKATIELVRAMLARAQDARFGEGRFNKASPLSRDLARESAINSAYAAITRFRKVREISFRNPELLSLMAFTMVESKRYDEARQAYSELIDHYRPLQQSLADASIFKDQVWPFFAIDYFRKQSRDSMLPMIGGIPNRLVFNLPDLAAVLALKDRIEKSGRKVSELEEKAVALGREGNAKSLIEARVNQNMIEAAYQQMVLKKQKQFSKSLASDLNKMLAEAEYKRGELALREIQGLKKQMGVARDYQADAIRSFEAKLKKIDEGGS